jgi:beta-galactosidase
MRHAFPFGVVYFFEDAYSPDEIRRDVHHMADLGFDLITLWPASNPWLAPRPTDFVFDATLQVLDVLREHDMQAVIQLIGQNPSQEYMPDCLLTPEMLVQPGEGRVGGGTWANPNHPAVDDAVHRYIRACVLALKDHPAVYAWDVYNEAHLRTDDPWTLACYHRWLERKYGTIEHLNHRWYRRHASFSQVNPRDRRFGYSAWSSLLPAVDYEQFRADNLTEICRRWVGYVREVDTARPVMVDGTTAQILAEDITLRNNDEFGTAQIADIYGGTFYPKSWGRNLSGMLWALSLYYELPAAAARKAARLCAINELQTHTQSALTPGSEVRPHELAAWIWVGIASGAKILQLFRWRPFMHGYQSSGRGLTGLDGSPNERAAAVKSLVQVLRQNEQLIASAHPVKPAVQILVSYRSRLVHDAFLRWQKTDYPNAIRGWYKVFWEWGFPVAIGNLGQLDQDDMTIPVLVLPSTVSVARREAEWLRQYVENGGCLIADARMAVVDEWGVVPSEKIPGKTLSEVFGFVEQDVGGESSFTLDDEDVPASFLTQLVSVSEHAHALARLKDGHPALIRHGLGKGTALYFTSFMGLTFLKSEPALVKKLLKEQVLAAAPATPWAVKSGNIHFALHRDSSRCLAYLVSMSNEAEVVSLHNLPAKGQIVDLASEEPIVDVRQIPMDPWQARLLSWQDGR